MVDRKKARPRLVGGFIRKRREELGLSQRSLGQLFQPPVTTQFISNVERGVTPLPPNHVATLAQALKINEEELMKVLEREYAAKLSDRLGIDGSGPGGSLDASEEAFLSSVVQAYNRADDISKRAFKDACRSILRFED